MRKPPPKLLSVEQAATYLGIGRGSAYEAARNGQIPTVRIGKPCPDPAIRA